MLELTPCHFETLWQQIVSYDFENTTLVTAIFAPPLLPCGHAKSPNEAQHPSFDKKLDSVINNLITIVMINNDLNTTWNIVKNSKCVEKNVLCVMISINHCRF